MLDHNVRIKFVGALMKVPVTETYKGRSSLLASLPPVGLNRSEDSRQLDLNLIIQQVDQLGRVKGTGVRPLVRIAQNALDYLGEWESEVTSALREVIRELDEYYGGEVPAPSAPPMMPEVLVFKNRDERVPFVFLESAIRTSKSVARLMVPRYFDGSHKEKDDSFGTGWLVAPGLIITNHHVVEARDREFESPAKGSDFELQAANIRVWFDYLLENGDRIECSGSDLVASNEKLDYALLRLTDANRVADRPPLPIIQQQPTLERGKRLNIVQHSGGSPLQYAFRNNFYVGPGDSAHFIRYLTDTQKGSSGSPVLDDSWQVVALHHSGVRIKPELYNTLPQERYLTLPEEVAKGEVITFHNEGVAIHSILNDLKPQIQQQIKASQDWKQS